MTTARAHMVVRRKAKDGTPGAAGAKVRFCTYTTGRAYLSGGAGEEFYDVAFHVTYQQFFRCIKSYPASETHSPTQSGNNAYWEWQQGLEMLFVNMLCANEAFLNNLTVRHMYTTDGKVQIIEGGLLKAYNAYLQDVKIFGTSRCPFVRYDGSWSWDESSAAQLHDNLLMAGGGSWVLAAGGFPWDVGQNGRRVWITTHRYNGTLSEGAVEIDAPSGKYFFEDGKKKSSLKLASREAVELLGIGEDNTFYGWLVCNRLNIETNKMYGRKQLVLANGSVTFTGTTSSPSCSISFKAFDGSTITASVVSGTTGRYCVTFPSAWGLSSSDYMVMLTPKGRASGSSSEACLKATLMEQYSNYFYVELSDDATNNWGGGFNFQIINLNDWT